MTSQISPCQFKDTCDGNHNENAKKSYYVRGTYAHYRHGLRQDQIRLTEAVNNFYAAVKPDALRIVENRTIPTAYALAGDSEALLDYLETMVEQFGPWEFYYFALNPSFDIMRDLPRFQALDKQYRQWLEQHQ